jgi:hypothetical protein
MFYFMTLLFSSILIHGLRDSDASGNTMKKWRRLKKKKNELNSSSNTRNLKNFILFFK